MNSERHQLEEKLQYKFHNENLLTTAVTHSSYVREHCHEGKSNERLEFLGDAFFDAIIGEELFSCFPQQEEGFLSRIRATLVCEKSLAKEARKLDLGRYLLLGNGEEKSGGRDRDSILADGMEAVIGAIYLDGGYEQVRSFVVGIFQDDLQAAGKGRLTNRDYKSEIQEQLQARGILDMQYVLEKEEGPDHNKIFSVRLEVLGEPAGRGKGKSKKLAEQNAAKDAMERGIDVL